MTHNIQNPKSKPNFLLLGFHFSFGGIEKIYILALGTEATKIIRSLGSIAAQVASFFVTEENGCETNSELGISKSMGNAAKIAGCF